MMDLQDKPNQKPDYRLEKLDDELLLYHPDRTVIMYCNPTASLVWQLCNGQRTIRQMIDLLGAAYDQPEAVITADVMSTLEKFCQQGAVQLGGAVQFSAEDKPVRKSG